MRIPTRILVFVAFSLALTGLSAPTRAETVDAFGTALKDWAAKEKVSRAFVVVRHGGKLVFQYALGGLDPKQPVQLASLSKAITGTCVATLVRDGKLTFETPLASALRKFFAANGNPIDSRTPSITIAQLLQHRSGIAGKTSGGDPATGSILVGFLASHSAASPPGAAFFSSVFQRRLIHDPGTAFDYSNAGYLVLGAVIEEATGKAYASYCRDAVLTPEGATGELDPKWALIAPFGGWRLSAENYLRFTDIFDPANPTLGKTAQAFLFSPPGANTTFPGASWYSLGTNVRRSGDGYTTWHLGEWRYAIATKDNPLTVDFDTFVARTADGTAWFAYMTPAVTNNTAKDRLDAALFNAYRSVTVWP